jgi:carbamoyltransferase
MFLGINANNHDASVTLVKDNNILFAGHAERYSRVKNDSNLNAELLEDCFSYGEPTQIYWYEEPWKHSLRNIISGERPIFRGVKSYLKKYKLDHIPIKTAPHHGAHAAMGYYTSGFSDAVIVVIDAIGEYDCTTIWSAKNKDLTKIWSAYYPDSIGLFYSAITDYLGFKSNEEEYIVMGMAAYGEPKYRRELLKEFFIGWDTPQVQLRHNLHRGMRWWTVPPQNRWRDIDIAASAQWIYEKYLQTILSIASSKIKSKNLVLVGGCALNCVANSLVSDCKNWENIWIPPNPGDSGLSLGAIAWYKHEQFNFQHAFLGYDIKRNVNVNSIVAALQAGKVIGVANGRAEFGPRALGNRSILADPRGEIVKDRVNMIKKRERFRPFAPIILSEHYQNYFYSKENNHDYMQFADPCLDSQHLPAICHVDGTSRLQTIPKNSPSITRQILEAWYAQTGCPLLLNTSLNIKGEPLVNTWADAERFSKLHNVRIF